MTGVFKKGANEIFAYFSKLIDNIIAWFKKNLKVFEIEGKKVPDLDEADIDWMASKKNSIGNFGGKIQQAVN